MLATKKLYLVGGWPTPLKKMSQLGWWNSQLNGKMKNVPNHQPDIEYTFSNSRSCHISSWMGQYNENLRKDLYSQRQGGPTVTAKKWCTTSVDLTSLWIIPYSWLCLGARVSQLEWSCVFTTICFEWLPPKIGYLKLKRWNDENPAMMPYRLIHQIYKMLDLRILHCWLFFLVQKTYLLMVNIPCDTL